MVGDSRRPVDGRLRNYDDSQFCVYGYEGLLDLTDKYEAQHLQTHPWSDSPKDMTEAQRRHTKLRCTIAECEKAEDRSVRDDHHLCMLSKGNGVLLQLQEVARKDETVKQVVAPEGLRKTCMVMFYEGYSHPGSQRCLETLEKFYFWKSLRKKTLRM